MRTSISAAVEGRNAWPPAPRCASRRAHFSGGDAGPGWCSCVEEVRMWGYGTQTDVGVAEGLKCEHLFLAVYLTTLIQESMGSRISTPHHVKVLD